ncbi:Phosphate-import permease protein PhnE [Planctomycetes bacterium Poly30]|uniref:Phosphate-import permease protein PhnE n=1 Tax=Saltatorellus ferox TaxID=2528018 RepID=A0A518ETX6_9BACT|nr:Phosphate-import permease protein PhnE [Planctomycetes bacterium Poly30]
MAIRSTSTIDAGGPIRRFPLGARALTLALIAAAGVVSARYLGLDLAGLWPRDAGWNLGGDLLGAAVHPAFGYENEVPPGTPAFPWRILGALWRTVLFAAGAMSLALPLGLLLSVLASDRFWQLRRRSGGSPAARIVQVAVRILIALMRSLHELLWAVLFLAALGLNSAAAVVSIAIPFAGTLAKVGSEMIDETSKSPAAALQDSGAGRWAALLVGVLPAALPELLSYAFYRFECAIRSAAVLGFFGYPTIGLYVAQSFENYQLREVWAYLYALIALVVLVEAWSRGVRRRLS